MIGSKLYPESMYGYLLEPKKALYRYGTSLLPLESFVSISTAARSVPAATEPAPARARISK